MKKVHYISADGEVKTVETDEKPGSDEMRIFLDGYLELVWVLFGGEKTQMYVNDEGMLDDLPYNQIATNIYHEASRQDHSLENGRKNPRFIDDFKQLEPLENAPPIVGNAIVLEGWGDS